MYVFLGFSQALKVNLYRIGLCVVVSKYLQICAHYESEDLVSKREEGQEYLNCLPFKTLGNKTSGEEKRRHICVMYRTENSSSLWE